MSRGRCVLVAVVVLATRCVWTAEASGQDARTLHAQAAAESNQEKQVMLLCKAAELEPLNKEYRKDCDVSKSALINSDKQALKTALEASDSGQSAKAKRYARYVSSLDPDTHRQADMLLAKLNAGDGPVNPPTSLTSQTAPPSQGALLGQALTAYDAGNLQAARADAQGITDSSVKPAANRILADIDRYSGFVSAGQRQEQAKEYADAERSYQAALDINAHVSADDLAGRLRRLQPLAATMQKSGAGARTDLPKVQTADTRGATKAPDVSPEEKKRRLLDESTQAMGRNDLDTAGRKFKQILDLDPANADAKRGLADITALLSRDPVRLEKTLREAITAFYASHFEDAESRLNRYLGADGGKKKGAAYFYLGATEATLAMLDDASKRNSRTAEAADNFKQARSAGYQPVERYVSTRVLAVWKSSGS